MQSRVAYGKVLISDGNTTIRFRHTLEDWVERLNSLPPVTPEQRVDMRQLLKQHLEGLEQHIEAKKREGKKR